MQTSIRFFAAVFVVCFVSGSAFAQQIQDGNAQVRLARPDKTSVDPRKAALFKASVITSQMTVTVTKDESVPVKATFNIMSGTIDLSGAAPAVKVVLDVTSWNSNLLERDDRVRKLFFHSDEPGFGTMTVTLDAVDQDTVARLRAEGKTAGVAVTGNLAFNGNSRPIAAKLNMGFNDKNRLAVLSAEPAVIKISEWGLSENLKTLIEACGHKSVADEVKAEFVFEFEAVK